MTPDAIEPTPESTRGVVAANLKARRKACGLTGSELGGRMGLSGLAARTSVARWETGNRLSLETLDRLARALGTTAWELCRPVDSE